MENIVIYITYGYPDIQTFFEILDLLDKMGVKIIEIGLPVEDPFMDGDVIRETHKEVLAKIKGNDYYDSLVSALIEIKKKYNFQVTLMTYKEGVKKFEVDKLDTDLYDSLLCVDHDFDNLNQVYIFNNEMSVKSLIDSIDKSKHFIYLMSGTGTTGSFKELPQEYVNMIPIIRSLTSLPIYIGFGVKSISDIQEIESNGGSGVIIGSGFIQSLQDGGLAGAEAFLNKLIVNE